MAGIVVEALHYLIWKVRIERWTIVVIDALMSQHGYNHSYNRQDSPQEN